MIKKAPTYKSKSPAKRFSKTKPSVGPKGLYLESDEFEKRNRFKFVEILLKTSPYIFEELKAFLPEFIQLYGTPSSNDEISDVLTKAENLRKAIANLSGKEAFPHTKSTLAVSRFVLQQNQFQLKYLKDGFANDVTTRNSIDEFPPEYAEWHRDSEAANVLHTNFLQFGAHFARIGELVRSHFESTSLPPERSVKVYVDLQCNLFAWAEKHHLEESWLLDHAYIFLSHLSRSEDFSISDLQSWSQGAHKHLVAKPPNLCENIEGWSAGKESAGDYQRRILQEVKTLLADYVIECYQTLRLDKRILVTKPKDPHYESIYWLIAWNQGALLPQIAKAFNRHTNDVKDRINALKKFGIPKRIDTPGRKKDLVITDERVQEIKAVFATTKTTKRKGVQST